MRAKDQQAMCTSNPRQRPAYAPLMVLSSVYAGYFFNSFRGRFNNVKNLFFWENNGFMFGIIAAFLP